MVIKILGFNFVVVLLTMQQRLMLWYLKNQIEESLHVPNKKNPHIIDVSCRVKTLIVDFLAIFNSTRINATFTLVIVVSTMVVLVPIKVIVMTLMVSNIE